MTNTRNRKWFETHSRFMKRYERDIQSARSGNVQREVFHKIFNRLSGSGSKEK